MGAAQSSAGAAPGGASSLDVLQPGRPLHAFLSAAQPPPPPPAAPPPPPPADPDADFWSALFHDFVVFDAAAAPAHRAALRGLCRDAARAAPAPAPAPRAIARALRAAVPRVRDYAEAPAAGAAPAPPREVLGALLLAARVLSGLAEGSNVTALCLVVGGDGGHDGLHASDRRDIGRSVVWQLLTCALDCISRPHSQDPVSPSIALASISVVLVALSTIDLAPAPGDSANSPHADDASSSTAGDDASLIASIVDKYSRPAHVLFSLLELAADGAAHRELALGSAPSAYSPAAMLAKSTATSPFATAAVVPTLSSTFPVDDSEDPETLVASVSRRLSNAMLLPSPLGAALAARLPSAGTPSNVFFPPNMLWAQSPLERDVLEGSRALPSVPPPTPSSSDAVGLAPARPTSYPIASAASAPQPSSATDNSFQRRLSSPAADRIGTLPPVPQFIPRAPTLLAEQALALVAVLCSPRDPGFSFCSATAAAARSSCKRNDGPASEGKTKTHLPPNPYRAALLSLHDLPQQSAGDDAAYSFRRLYETLGAWADDPRGALVAYHLIVGNRRFRTFVLARTDPDVLLVPLLSAMYMRASPSACAAPADAYIPAIIVLVLSSDTGFCAAIDEITVPLSALLWYEERVRLNGSAISLSGIALLVCIRCIQQSLLSKRRVIESFLASTCMSILGNLSSSVTGINNLAADRLVALIEFLGKRRRKSALTAAHEKEMPVSPPPPAHIISPRRLPTLPHTACSLPRDGFSLSRPSPVSNAAEAVVERDARMEDEPGSLANGTEALLEGTENKELISASVEVPELAPVGDVYKENLNGDDASVSAHLNDIVFSQCGVEASENDCQNTLTELLGTLLEVITSILRSRSNVSANRHLVYSLLHREAIFSADYVSDVSTKSRVISCRIRSVILFFSKWLDQFGASALGGTNGVHDSSTLPLSSRAASALSSADIKNHVAGQSQAGGQNLASSGPGISVDRVFDVIDRYSRTLPHDTLFALPELRFLYCEAQVPQDFFLPYAWVLAMRASPLQWEPAQYPDSRIPLAKSVFHPPRPPHGSGLRG